MRAHPGPVEQEEKPDDEQRSTERSERIAAARLDGARVERERIVQIVRESGRWDEYLDAGMTKDELVSEIERDARGEGGPT